MNSIENLVELCSALNERIALLERDIAAGKLHILECDAQKISLQNRIQLIGIEECPEDVLIAAQTMIHMLTDAGLKLHARVNLLEIELEVEANNLKAYEDTKQSMVQ